MHLANAFFNDALDSSAPAGVENSNGAVLGIDQNHGQAVGGENSQQNSGGIGDQAVAGEWFAGDLRNTVDDVGVDLAKGDELGL